MAMAAAPTTYVTRQRTKRSSRLTASPSEPHEQQCQNVLSRRSFKKFEKSLEADQASPNLVALLKAPTLFDL